MLNKKGAVPIAIVLLVLATLVLAIVAVFSFSVRNNDFTSVIRGSSDLESVYVDEHSINFLLQNIVENSAGKSSTSGDFLNNVKDSMAKNRNLFLDYGVDFDKLEQSLTSENVIFSFEEQSIFLEIDLKKERNFRNNKILLIEYSYNKKFSAEV